MLNILFKVDGSPFIGMGHIMRCLSLAREFRNFGCNVSFVSRYSEGINEIKRFDFNVIQLKDYSHEEYKAEGFSYGNPTILECEAEQMNKLIIQNNIELLIIDSYNVTLEYFIKLKNGDVKIAYIDDINSFDYPVDILINGNISALYLNYNKYANGELLLLGTEYNLIREEFRNIETRKINPQAHNILITTGGADPYNFSVRLLKFFINNSYMKNFSYSVIVGNGFKNKDELRDISKLNNQVRLYENVRMISEIMLNCDIAISSGGSTLYELCACGTPTLGFVMAENQRKIVSIMNEKGYINSLGWYNNITDFQLIHEVVSLCENYQARKEMSMRMQKLVDGHGTTRIVKEILKQFS